MTTETAAVPQSLEPKVTDFEAFACRRNAARGDLGEAALHKAHSRLSPKQRDRMLRDQLIRDAQWQVRRDAARTEYDRLVAQGAIRPPTRRERLERTAAGHPDNGSLQAARRLLALHYGTGAVRDSEQGAR